MMANCMPDFHDVFAQSFKAMTQPQTASEIRKLLEEAEVREAAEAEREALKERLDYEKQLAMATMCLLGEIVRIKVEHRQSEMQYNFATFRKELAPLAATYGLKIVLVGDKTRGVLTYA